MKHVRILLHAFLAILPVLVGRWIVCRASLDSFLMEFAGYNCALYVVVLAVIGLGSFFPQLVLVAARNAQHASVDYHWKRVPVHPIGWVTVLGVWGHIPALWMASKLSGDIYPVSFSFLGPPLIVVSMILSRRWVEGTSPPRSEGGGIDGQGPAPDEF